MPCSRGPAYNSVTKSTDFVGNPLQIKVGRVHYKGWKLDVERRQETEDIILRSLLVYGVRSAYDQLSRNEERYKSTQPLRAAQELPTAISRKEQPSVAI